MCMIAVIASPDLFGGKQSLPAGRLNEIAASSGSRNRGVPDSSQ
jgi:hypothetical protein